MLNKKINKNTCHPDQPNKFGSIFPMIFDKSSYNSTAGKILRQAQNDNNCDLLNKDIRHAELAICSWAKNEPYEAGCSKSNSASIQNRTLDNSPKDETKKLWSPRTRRDWSRLAGFSLAEAMIMLLMVSIIIAAMAPIMSKKMKLAQTGYNSLYRAKKYMLIYDDPSKNGTEENIFRVPAGAENFMVSLVGGGGSGGDAVGGEVDWRSPGTYSWTVPAGVTEIEVTLVSGGAGGGGGGVGVGEVFSGTTGSGSQSWTSPGSYSWTVPASAQIPAIPASCAAAGITQWTLVSDPSQKISPGGAMVSVTACGGGGGASGGWWSQPGVSYYYGGAGGNGGYYLNKAVVIPNSSLSVIVGGGGGAGGSCCGSTRGSYGDGGGCSGCEGAGGGGGAGYQDSYVGNGGYRGGGSNSYGQGGSGGGVAGSMSAGSGGCSCGGGAGDASTFRGGGGGGMYNISSAGNGAGGGGGATAMKSGSTVLLVAGGGGGAGSSSWNPGNCGCGGGGGGGYNGGAGGRGSGDNNKWLATAGSSNGTGGMGSCPGFLDSSVVNPQSTPIGGYCQGGYGWGTTGAQDSDKSRMKGLNGYLSMSWAATSNTLKCTYNMPANGASGGGGAAIVPKQKVQVTPGETLTIIVGAGGAGGAPGENGSNARASFLKRGDNKLLLTNPTANGDTGWGGPIAGRADGTACTHCGAGGIGGTYGHATTGTMESVIILGHSYSSSGFAGGNRPSPPGFNGPFDPTNIPTDKLGGDGGITAIDQGTAPTSADYAKLPDGWCRLAKGGTEASKDGQNATGFGGCGGGGGYAGGKGGDGAGGYVRIKWGGTTGGGGSGGEVIEQKYITGIKPGEIVVTVGAGGVDGNGGVTSFGTYLSAKGGLKGGNGGMAKGSHGKGALSVGNGSHVGLDGQDGLGGNGGKSLYKFAKPMEGAGGCGGNVSENTCNGFTDPSPLGKAGAQAGGGGGGGTIKDSRPYKGGNGGNGIVIIEWE